MQPKQCISCQIDAPAFYYSFLAGEKETIMCKECAMKMIASGIKPLISKGDLENIVKEIYEI